jgi:hypothetical protein
VKKIRELRLGIQNCDKIEVYSRPLIKLEIGTKNI